VPAKSFDFSTNLLCQKTTGLIAENYAHLIRLPFALFGRRGWGMRANLQKWDVPKETGGCEPFTHLLAGALF
jgi:hypothetical protein